MNLESAEKIVNAVLYEGYILYPYRPTAIKNRQRWTFGGLFPAGSRAARKHGDPSRMQLEVPVLGTASSRLDLRIRFLHLTMRQAGELPQPLDQLSHGQEPSYRPVPVLEIGGERHFSWQEAVEREFATSVPLGELCEGENRVQFACPPDRDIQPLRDDDGRIAGILVRSQLPLEVEIAMSARPDAGGGYRLKVVVENRTVLEDPGVAREEAQLQAMASTHAILGIEAGEFVSLLDPPGALKEIAESCDNRGCWPVLVGEEGRRDTLLASPIILYDYPQIAPESPGDLFDGLEIDELLTLRILTMTPQEKQEMAAVDERARTLLERTEGLTTEEMAAMHGALRNLRAVDERSCREPGRGEVVVDGAVLGVGDRVRLNPKAGGDIFDVVLRGKTAVIEAIERDFEDRVHIAVALDDDPGRDLGLARMPGHRFFFSPDEIQAVASAAGERRRSGE